MSSPLAYSPNDGVPARAATRMFSYPAPSGFGYATAQPFPHLVLQNSWDSGLLDACKAEIGQFSDWDGEKDFYGSKKKRFCGDIERLPPSVARLINEASSPAFLHWLMDLTGEPALLPDPYLEGGGIHQIIAGGFLKIHADFNWNDKTHLYRRLNLLLYLNRDWDPDWGGSLELWKQDMSRSLVSVTPEFNTMVLFTTDDKSFHGHPQPLVCPAGIARDSIALYYYSPIKPSTNFKERRVGTDYRPITGDTFEYYDPSFSARIKTRLKRLLAR